MQQSGTCDNEQVCLRYEVKIMLCNAKLDNMALRPGALNPLGGWGCGAVLCDDSFDADTYVGLARALGLLSIHSSGLTEVGNYVILDEERPIVPSTVLSSHP